MPRSVVEHASAEAVATRHPKHTSGRRMGQPRSLANRVMWLVILWCAGFGATFLVVLPFHLLVQWAIHR
ncbi:hypothetical protein [Paraburkholderia solisilvae]|uniref:DUF2474 domain-containing protein n=1 Tax=Paraburkholderia solisilvae TaxID=624376 RepID=A0A6J5E079_9BURK|nr:hypothetical protein [Paraburkholderia solisilvae]CAB3759798.1 hypothetical protein LMG29739_03245 [Paraburkholderia solisilvae]